MYIQHGKTTPFSSHQISCLLDLTLRFSHKASCVMNGDTVLPSKVTVNIVCLALPQRLPNLIIRRRSFKTEIVVRAAPLSVAARFIRYQLSIPRGMKTRSKVRPTHHKSIISVFPVTAPVEEAIYDPIVGNVVILIIRNACAELVRAIGAANTFHTLDFVARTVSKN